MKFSEKEINDLLKAWIAISIAFAILLNRDFFSPSFSTTLIVSSITVGVGFLLHELGHKYVAQKYHFWAEFRASNGMLIFAILMSLFLKVIFLAPGAVMIHGYYMTKEKNGKISAAGPMVNFILAVLFIILLALGINNQLTNYGAFINSWIGLFNMLPVWNIDGKKILNWSKPVYFSMVGVGLLVLFLSSALGTI